MQSIATGVQQFVGVSVGPDREPCKNGRTDRDAVWDVDSGVPKEPCIRRWSRSLHVKAQGAILKAKSGLPRTYPDMSRGRYIHATQQGAISVRCGSQMGCTRLRCTLAQSGEYD